MSAVVLLHGGTMARRSALSKALRAAFGDDLRVRVSSSAAEAAKCLADPAMAAVFLLDAPHDSSAVRTAVTARGLSARVYDLEPRDGDEVLRALVREVLHGA